MDLAETGWEGVGGMSGQRQVSGSCEHGTEIPASIKFGTFLGQPITLLPMRTFIHEGTRTPQDEFVGKQ